MKNITQTWEHSEETCLWSTEQVTPSFIQKSTHQTICFRPCIGHLLSTQIIRYESCLSDLREYYERPTLIQNVLNFYRLTS